MLKTVGFPSTRTGDQTIVDGNLVIGTSGKGIDFSATPGTGTSELLADYEEGDWTPGISFATPGDLSVAYSTQFGSYTRVGNRVILSFQLITSTYTYTTASGNLRLTGIPFTSATTTGSFNTGNLIYQGITKVGYTQICPTLGANATFMNLQCSGSGVAVASVATTDIPSGSAVILRGTMTYQV